MRAHLEEKVECSVHAADIDKQTYHGHVKCSLSMSDKLFAENPGRLRRPRHGINVDVSKREAFSVLVCIGENLLVIVENVGEKVVLNVNTP